MPEVRRRPERHEIDAGAVADVQGVGEQEGADPVPCHLGLGPGQALGAQSLEVSEPAIRRPRPGRFNQAYQMR